MVLLTGVSKYLFTALALGVVLAMARSYIVAMTVVPLFCAYFITVEGHGEEESEYTAENTDPAELAIDRREEAEALAHKDRSPFEFVVWRFNHFFHSAIQIRQGDPVLS